MYLGFQKRISPKLGFFGAVLAFGRGILFHYRSVPEWLQHLALSLPICHSQEALRICLLGGQGYWSLESHLITLALWATIGLPVGYLCVHAGRFSDVAGGKPWGTIRARLKTLDQTVRPAFQCRSFRE